MTFSFAAKIKPKKKKNNYFIKKLWARKINLSRIQLREKNRINFYIFIRGNGHGQR